MARQVIFGEITSAPHNQNYQELYKGLVEAESVVEQGNEMINLAQVATDNANQAANSANEAANKANLATDNANQAANRANQAASNAEAKIIDVETRFQTLTAEQQLDSEVIDARKGFPSLRGKIDDIDNQLANIINSQTALALVEEGIGSIPSNAIKGQIDVTVKGKTVNNLMGTDGDCEDVSKFTAINCTLAPDTTNKVFGNNGIVITIATGQTQGIMNYNIFSKLSKGKYYLITAYLKRGNCTDIRLRLETDDIDIESVAVTATSFTRMGIVVQPSDIDTATNAVIQIIVNGAAGQYGYVDGIMVNEITAEEYVLGVTACMARYNYHNATRSVLCGRISTKDTQNNIVSQAYIPNIVLRGSPYSVKDEYDITEGKHIQRIGLDTTNPADPTFTRSSVAYKSDGTQVPANTPRFELGKFGQAVMVEEGTTNLVKNPSFEDTTDWDQLDRTTEAGACHGNYACKVTYNWQQYQIITGITSGQTYTISAYGKNGQGSAETRIVLRAERSDGTLIQTWNILWDETNWTRKSLTVTAPAETAQFRMCLTKNGGENNSATNYGYIDAVQLEAKPYATSFIDGTRAAETLTIPTAGVLNPQEGEISVWVYVNNFLKTNYGTTKQIFWWFGAAGRISLGWNTGRDWYTVTGNGTYTSVVSISDTLSVGWHLFTIRYNATELALLIDGGAQKATAPNPYLPSGISDSAYIGSGAGNYYINTLIDDLRISSRARSDKEIAAAYASGQPLPVDEWTTYKLGFNGNLTKERANPVYYPLATPIITQYPSQSLVGYPNSTIYWEPVVAPIEAIYNNRITIPNTNLPIKRLDQVKKRVGNSYVDINLDGCIVASDGLSFTINGALNGEVYVYSYYYDTSLSTLPSMEITFPVNVAATLDQIIELQQKLLQEIEKVWITLLPLADKELRMYMVSTISTPATATTNEIANKVNEIINIWKSNL